MILFGATGYTGRLTAEAMTRAGLAPVLAGRSPDALVALTGDLAGLAPLDAAPSWQSADVDEPESVRALVRDAADVLVTTVGPFARLGEPALAAAISAGSAYLDSTGESPFIRRVFEDADGPARESGARLLTAFGYDYVPGNLAGALAIADARAAGRIPTVVEIGYFVRGTFAISSGTRASAADVATSRPFALRNGQVVEHAGSIARFTVGGRSLEALPVGTSEHFTLPRLDPGVRDVGVYLGWAGRWTRAARVGMGVLQVGGRVPGLSGLLRAGMDRATGSTTGQGPTPAQRAGARTVVVARTLDGVGRQLSSATLEGPDPYGLTAELLAWGSAMLLTGRARDVGALGPVDAFGLDALADGCAQIGLHRVG